MYSLQHYNTEQEGRAVARKPRGAAAVLFGLIHPGNGGDEMTPSAVFVENCIACNGMRQLFL